MTDTMTAPEPNGLSLGLGPTDAGNLACSFCYRDPNRTDCLGATEFERMLGSLPVRTR